MWRYEQTIKQRGWWEMQKIFWCRYLHIWAGYGLLLINESVLKLIDHTRKMITASFKNKVRLLNYSLWKLTNHIILLLNGHIEAIHGEIYFKIFNSSIKFILNIWSNVFFLCASDQYLFGIKLWESWSESQY